MASFERIKTFDSRRLRLVNVDNITSIHHNQGESEVLIYNVDGEEKYTFDTPENAREWVMRILKDY